jgi:aspartate ammonia-lyase
VGDQRADEAFERRLHTVLQADGATRTETDSLRSKAIPADAYWGINVSRAVDNFAISGRRISEYPDLIRSAICSRPSD